jgi:hypothetical protein
VLYRTIAAHLPTFLARTGGADGTGGWPAFVRREFEAYLRCGILDHGLLRVRCERCGDTTVVGFSCKGRGYAEWWNMRSTEAVPGATLRRAGAVPLVRGVRDFA